MTFFNSRFRRLASAGVLLVLAGGALQGCGVVLVGAAAGEGVLVANDRRSTATQWADTTIQLKADQAVTDALNKRGHVSITSFYRKALLTGEVPTDEDRARAQAAVAAVPDVVSVINYLAVMPDSSTGQRSDDTLITGKVKTALLQTDGVPLNSMKIVTDRSTVYLMGRLTRRETDLATEATRRVGGVVRVVRVIDFISAQEALHPNDRTDANPALVPAPVSDTAPAPPASDAGGVVTHPVK